MNRRGSRFAPMPGSYAAYARNYTSSNRFQSYLPRSASTQTSPVFAGDGQVPRQLSEERSIVGPFGFTGPQARPLSPAWLLLLGNGMASEATSRPRSLARLSLPPFVTQQSVPLPTQEHGSRQSEDEQRNPLRKLKKEIYNNSMAKRLTKRVSFYYRDLAKSDTYENDIDEEARCAICLEDFKPMQEVMTTPCKHMYHEECIVPWVKSSGKCPICRFEIGERVRGNSASNMAPPSEEEILSIFRVLGVAFARDLS